MRLILIIFNIMFYLVFVAVLLLALVLDDSEKSQDIQGVVGGIWPLVRDFGFSVILCVFVTNLKHRKLDESQAGEALDEAQLGRITIMLIISILARGSIALAQGLIYADPVGGETTATTECSLGIWIMVLVQDFILEGLPFIVLIRVNTKELEEQNGYSVRSRPLYARAFETSDE
jgi:phosphatidylglycerophosphate synthase